MKLNHVVAGAVLAFGLGAGSLVGASAAGAAPVGPGAGFAEKPHHHHGWKHPGKGPHHAKWRGGDIARGVDACISATSPTGNVSGFVCI